MKIEVACIFGVFFAFALLETARTKFFSKRTRPATTSGWR